MRATRGPVMQVEIRPLAAENLAHIQQALPPEHPEAHVRRLADQRAGRVTYLVASVLLGAAFIHGSLRLMRHPERRNALRLYLFSLGYLAALFAAMVVDVRL